jgi:DNA polymerase I-like protein with 3'-5' exonuclease and polymerase domains
MTGWCCAAHGVDLAGVDFDTMVASYLINPGKRAHGLDQIALDYLGHKNITYADVAGKGKGCRYLRPGDFRKGHPLCL